MTHCISSTRISVPRVSVVVVVRCEEFDQPRQVKSTVSALLIEEEQSSRLFVDSAVDGGGALVIIRLIAPNDPHTRPSGSHQSQMSRALSNRPMKTLESIHHHLTAQSVDSWARGRDNGVILVDSTSYLLLGEGSNTAVE